ncbi:hypothetical protein U5B17_08400 [Campylobacter sp. 1BO]|uniref:hypothetical protein n=1 Tax=Campylobacter sp. 1BO TaxID=3424760 RepID=UPI003D356815
MGVGIEFDEVFDEMIQNDEIRAECKALEPEFALNRSQEKSNGYTQEHLLYLYTLLQLLVSLLDECCF